MSEEELKEAFVKALKESKGKQAVNNNVMASFRTIMAMERTLFSAFGMLAKAEDPVTRWLLWIAMGVNAGSVTVQMCANAATGSFVNGNHLVCGVAVVSAVLATVGFYLSIAAPTNCGGDDTLESIKDTLIAIKPH